MRYLVGIVGFPLGIVVIVYRERIKRFTGDFAFAESWFGPGGTYTALLLFGLLLSLGSLMYALGTIQLVLSQFFGKFFAG
ncbi:MAG: hypothetical protein AAB588_05570 [Patescibacteria group bacterium]